MCQILGEWYLCMKCHMEPVIGDDPYYSWLVIDDNLNMGYMSCGNCSLNNHNISQQYCDSNNDYVSSGYGI